MFFTSVQRLVILRGPEHDGKAALARAVAGGLPGKSAVIHFADLRERWIVHHGDDRAAETEMCYRLLKLIAVTYLKDGYNVVVDAPYVGAHGGVSVREDDVNDLARLSRTFRGIRSSVVTLLPTAAGPEAAALTAALTHSHIPDEIRVEGEGGDVDAFAAALLERVAAT